MQQGQSLYVLQTELIDKKVEISVNNGLAAVNSTLLKLGEQITELRHEVRDLRTEMHQEIGSLRGEMHKEIGSLRGEMHKEISSLGTRLTAVETILGIRLERQTDLRNRFMDVSFKLGWVAIGAIMTMFISVFGKSLHF
jgi:hypothetical protein